jgi:hypothetical protein
MTTASPAFDGIRVRAAQIGLYETPILHGRLADVTALTAALGSGSATGHAQPRVLQCRWLVLATDMLDWGGLGRACHTALKIRNKPHILTVAIRRRSNGRSRCGRTSRRPRPLNMSHAQPS